MWSGMDTMEKKTEYIKAKAKVICFVNEDIIMASQGCADVGYEHCSESGQTQGCGTTSIVTCDWCVFEYYKNRSKY